MRIIKKYVLRLRDRFFPHVVTRCDCCGERLPTPSRYHKTCQKCLAW